MPLDFITSKALADGDMVALGAIEIISIPHVSIIGDGQSTREITEKYKNEMRSLLVEIYQTCKSMEHTKDRAKDASIELLWTTQRVENQPYNAKIRLFVIIRVIDEKIASAKSSVEDLLRICESTLALQKYEFAKLHYSELSDVISQINDTNIRAIVKEETTENLQNHLHPYCFSNEKIPTSNNYLRRIVNV